MLQRPAQIDTKLCNRAMLIGSSRSHRVTVILSAFAWTQAQAVTAQSLGIPATSYTKHDALAFRKQLLVSPQLRQQLLRGGPVDAKLHAQ